MASPETPPPSIRQGVRIVPPDSSVTVEEVLLAVGEQVGHVKLSFASRMNKAVVVFLKEEPLVYQLVESGVFIRDLFVQVSPLSVPSTRITVSGVPPFIPNELLENELRRFGKFAGGFKTVSLGCKDPKLKHVQSLRRQVFMFLDSPTQTLDVSFRVKHGDGFYMVYDSSGQFKCFECGDVGHKRFACPHRQQGAARSADAADGSVRSAAGGSGSGSAVVGSCVEPAAGESAAGESAAGGSAAGESGAGSAAVSAAGESGAGSTAGGSSAGAAVADAGADPGAVNVVAGVTGSVPHFEEVDLDSEEQSDPKKQQAPVAAENLSSSQSAGTEAASTSCTGRDPTVITTEGKGISSSQASCEGEDMEYDSESDTVSSIGEASKNTDLYSLEEINHFLDVTFKKSVRLNDYFSDTEKFIRSVDVLKRLVGFDLLDEKKRFRLKKHITILRKAKKGKTAKKTKKVT